MISASSATNGSVVISATAQGSGPASVGTMASSCEVTVAWAAARVATSRSVGLASSTAKVRGWFQTSPTNATRAGRTFARGDHASARYERCRETAPIRQRGFDMTGR